jgi:anti-sigma factor RsiW
MSNKASISNEACLTEEQLLRYAEGAITRDEERAIDRHIATCDMCSDAVEGAMMISAEAFKKHSASIGDKIDKTFDKTFGKVSDKNLLEKAQNMEYSDIPNPFWTEGLKENTPHTLKPVRRFRLLRWVAVAAASVLFLATAGVWLLTTNAPPNEGSNATSTETAMETAPPQSPIETTLLDTLKTAASTENLSAQNNSAVVTTTPQKPQQPLANSTPTGETNTLADAQTTLPKEDAPTAPVSFGSTAKPTTQSVDNQSIVEEMAKEKANELNTKREQETTYATSSELAKAQKRMEDKAASANAKAKMNPAADPTSSPKIGSNDEQYFQKGVTYFNQQDYGNALSNFNKIKQEKVSDDIYQQVRWLSATAQLKQGNKTVAKSIFETIVAEKGKYAAQAAAVLKASF